MNAPPDRALADLRTRMADALAQARMTKTQLAVRTGLGRTTVQQAFQHGGPAPSAETVAAIASALRLPVQEMLLLRHTVTEQIDPPSETRRSLGMPVSHWDPHDLDVHPASWRALPGYVQRPHDQALAAVVRAAAQGTSGLLVLIGDSSTGKSRACWESVQPLAQQGWTLWHPVAPTPAQGLLDGLPDVVPHTIVWLNEAQQYLGDPQHGPLVASAVHTLLTDPERAPVLFLGTLWPHFADRYACLPTGAEPDPHHRVRTMLSGRTLAVPDRFDEQALRAAANLARQGDALLADTLRRAALNGRVTQDLAGAPELLRRHREGTPTARALLNAAMDARRLAPGLQLHTAFVAEAAIDYLSYDEYDALPDDWAQTALAELARPVHGKQAPLRCPRPHGTTSLPRHGIPTAQGRPAPESRLRLADFLEQHGRTARRMVCPPASFWAAARAHITDPRELMSLASAARTRHRLQWAHHLQLRAQALGDAGARIPVQRPLPDRGAAPVPALPRGTRDLITRAHRHARDGDWDGFDELANQAVRARNARAVVAMAAIRSDTGHHEAYEKLCAQAALLGETSALVGLARIRASNSDWDGFDELADHAIEALDVRAVEALADIQDAAGNPQRADQLYKKAADAGGWWLHLCSRWPYGLDADGTPTSPWLP